MRAHVDANILLRLVQPASLQHADAHLFFARSRVSRRCPSPEGGHARQIAHVLAKRGEQRMSHVCPCDV